jgi:hypothetical protein
MADNSPNPSNKLLSDSNIGPEKDAAFAELREIGRSEGKGKTARLRAAQFVTAKAKEGLLDETDNQQIWEQILIGAGEEMAIVGGGDLRDTQQFKQRASDIKHFIILGKNPHYDGPKVLDNAVKRMKHLRETKATKSGRIWELLLGFARAQNNKPGKALPDKDIDMVMSDKAKKSGKKEKAEQLWLLRERVLKLTEDEELTGVAKCCDLLEAMVKELGGTKKQREAEKILKKAAKAKLKAEPKAKIQITTPAVNH